ncbi:phage major capsid protein [Flagellimonas sp.]|uniref:phage major capsid protein n=1 Tax=Flagellimonas sp. TaxID=2058762 RepID=UPI003F49BF31
MRKSTQIRQDLHAKLEAQGAISEGAKLENGETRALTTEEDKQFWELNDEIKALKSELRTAEANEENIELAARMRSNPVPDKQDDGTKKEKERVFGRASILKAIRGVNPVMDEELDGAEKEMHEIGLEENRSADIKVSGKSKSLKANTLSVPLRYLVAERATQQTVTQDSGAYGGALVQNQAPRMVDPLRPVLAFERLGATFWDGLVGGNIPLLVDNDFAMTFVAEGANITPQKKEYAGPTLAPKRAGGAVDISNQLIIQSSVRVENRVANGLRNGFVQLLHAACINGAGGVAPTGLLSLANVNASSVVAAKAPTWADIVELQKLIEQANATDQSIGYLLNPTLKAKLKTVAKDAGSGRFLAEGNMIDGYQMISTSQVPTLDDGGTPVEPLIFGDFSQMVIGQWGSINVTVNPYSADLADSVRLVLNTHADMQIANPAAFAKNAFLNAA